MASMMQNTITVEADFTSHLKLQRLTDRLDVAEKELKEYKDLFAMLYHNACEHCRESFPRNGGTGAAALSESSPVAQPLGPIVKPSSPSGGNDSPHGSSPFTESIWYRILKISLSGLLSGRHRRDISAAEPRSDRGTPTDWSSSSLWYRILKFFLPSFFFTGHGPNTPRVTGASTELETFAGPSNVSPSPSEDGYIHFVTEYHCKTVTKLTLEHVWIHDGWSGLTSVKFSPDGKYLAVGLVGYCGSRTQKTYIHDMTNGREICLLTEPYIGNHRHSPNHVSFSPDGRYLVMGNRYGGTTIWEVEKKRVRNNHISHPTWKTSSANFSPDGRYVVSSSFFDSTVCIWSMRDGSLRECVDDDDYDDDNGDGDGHAGEERVIRPVSDAKFSPDGKHVVSAGNMLKLWNVRTSKLVKKWNANQGFVTCVTFMPNGRGLVTAGSDHSLKYWDLGNPEVEFWEFFGHWTDISSVAVSPDGRWTFCGSKDGTVYIWDMVDASLQCRLQGHKYRIPSVDFSPTGNYMACGDQSGMTSVWRLESSGN